MLYYQKINCVFNKIKKGKLNIKKDSVEEYRHLNPYFDQRFIPHQQKVFIVLDMIV